MGRAGRFRPASRRGLGRGQRLEHAHHAGPGRADGRGPARRAERLPDRGAAGALGRGPRRPRGLLPAAPRHRARAPRDRSLGRVERRRHRRLAPGLLLQRLRPPGLPPERDPPGPPRAVRYHAGADRPGHLRLRGRGAAEPAPALAGRRTAPGGAGCAGRGVGAPRREDPHRLALPHGGIRRMGRRAGTPRHLAGDLLARGARHRHRLALVADARRAPAAAAHLAGQRRDLDRGPPGRLVDRAGGSLGQRAVPVRVGLRPGEPGVESPVQRLSPR